MIIFNQGFPNIPPPKTLFMTNHWQDAYNISGAEWAGRKRQPLKLVPV